MFIEAYELTYWCRERPSERDYRDRDLYDDRRRGDSTRGKGDSRRLGDDRRDKPADRDWRRDDPPRPDDSLSSISKNTLLFAKERAARKEEVSRMSLPFSLLED